MTTVGPPAVAPDSAEPGAGSKHGTEPGESEFETLAAAVDTAAAKVAELEPDARGVALDLQRAIEAFHRPALVAIVRRLRTDPVGKEILFELVDDPAVRAVLALQGIIKADPVTQTNRALESVRPFLQSHGGDVELVKLEDGAAFVRLLGSCNGCSMSAVTLRDTVSEAVVAAVAEVDRIEVVDDEPTAAFIPLASVTVRGGGSNGKSSAGWADGPLVADISDGAMVRFDIDEQSFVAINVDHRIAVFRNACVHQGLSLDGGLLQDGVITCPWHGFTFDATSGECLSAPGAQLEQVPTRVEDGRVRIRSAR